MLKGETKPPSWVAKWRRLESLAQPWAWSGGEITRYLSQQGRVAAARYFGRGSTRPEGPGLEHPPKYRLSAVEMAEEFNPRAQVPAFGGGTGDLWKGEIQILRPGVGRERWVKGQRRIINSGEGFKKERKKENRKKTTGIA